jgi:phosphopentomutase
MFTSTLIPVHVGAVERDRAVAAESERQGASVRSDQDGGLGRRAIVLVIDACGVGALPDAAGYGDAHTNTLLHVAEAVGELRLPTLQALGLGSILPLPGVPGATRPVIHGRLHALGPGKDSTAGHWELMGVVLEQSLPTYPEGFPPEILARLRQVTGREMICNLPYNGISAIEDFGAEHLESGALILYTSKDSVLQLAAHVERVPVQELWRACAAARETMSGEHAVGRVIARPFTGPPKAFERTEGRRDFALTPPSRSYLQELADAGVQTHGVGKISDLFAGVGIAVSHPGATNARALVSVGELLHELERGLVFANLIETDQVYGHRKDAHGFHRALRVIDSELGEWLARLRPDDLLIVTADHGVDPAHPGTDHTREHAPLLALTGAMLSAREPEPRHDGPLADVGATVLRWLAGREAPALPGRSFL